MSRADSRAAAPARTARGRWLRAALPLAVFAGLAALFYVALYSGDPSRLPSALIGKPVPDFALPPVEGLADNGKPVPGFGAADLRKGEVSIVNVWASWCVPCRTEHPFLVSLKEKSKAPLYGLSYKDEAPAARRFLGRYGNPFTAVGADRAGRTAINWGVYGVPETFIVDGRGRIVYKHVGPIDDQAIATKLLPAIAEARAGT